MTAIPTCNHQRLQSRTRKLTTPSYPSIVAQGVPLLDQHVLIIDEQLPVRNLRGIGTKVAIRARLPRILIHVQLDPKRGHLRLLNDPNLKPLRLVHDKVDLRT
uniref:(northern house mosquito) hypothetical protein n=1 Tax=Culex pipiens TaxID=7175 RepID=A0A8D8H2J6_CULPI